MKEVIGNCPVCDHDLSVTKLTCHNCETEISGDFRLSKFDYLSKTELAFVETFIIKQGNIKEIEKELNISYPTVKKNLNLIIQKLTK